MSPSAIIFLGVTTGRVNAGLMEVGLFDVVQLIIMVVQTILSTYLQQGLSCGYTNV